MIVAALDVEEYLAHNLAAFVLSEVMQWSSAMAKRGPVG